MLINLKVKTLDARTHEFSIDNEITIRQFKDQIAEKTNIAAENQRIIYQGRVLADDKQVKEYDVDGKVLHVAERPPFSQRGANATNNDEPMRNIRSLGSRPTGPRSMRNTPYFRGLDGMLVGTMAIPVNNGPITAAGTRTPPNRFPNSSSFCINRITVALHMIDCANNIAAYLENPEIGLNNQSLDILQRGRWTMESTVVEVGVSSTDMPRNNNIIDMVQDAVSAALSRNTPGRNYTVVQLPTVFTNEGDDNQSQRAGADGGNEGSTGGAAGSSDTSEETTAAAAVIIEDVIETDDEGGDGPVTPNAEDDAGVPPLDTAGASAPTTEGPDDTSATPVGENASNVAVTGIGPRRRTRPQVLADVIRRYRAVQTRLSPFVDGYHDILNRDPAFEESDTAGREGAQRTFDRVSEAFHYLSHAQHAISDLMLDLSQPGPRVLTCRPILVEQSGYIRSNNIFAPNLATSPLGDIIAQAPPTANAAPRSGTNGATQSATTTGSAAARHPTLTEVDHLAGDIAAVLSQRFLGTDRDQTANSTGSANTASQEQPQAGNDRPSAASGNTTDAGSPQPAAQASVQRDRWLALHAATTAAEAEATAAAAVVAGLLPPTESVEDPVDEPMVARNATTTTSGNQSSQPQPQQPPRLDMAEHEQPILMANMGGAPPPSLPVPRLRLYMPVPLPPPNPQVQMARFIQAVVNSATNDSDLHVEFNMPNVMSINLPVHVMTAAVHPQGRPSATANDTSAAPATGTATGAGESTGNRPAGATGTPSVASTSSGTRSTEQRANTLPTTATQTRSTSRPQIQFGGNNNWAGRIAPTHTAFDRFLPCNSHHIREPAPPAQPNNNNNSNNYNNNLIIINNGNRLATNGAGNTIVITSRLPRGQSGTGLSRRRRALSSRGDNRTGSLQAVATVGGVGSRAHLPIRRPIQRTLSRILSTISNIRNHAQTALGGIGTTSAGIGVTNANAASSTSATTVSAASALAPAAAGVGIIGSAPASAVAASRIESATSTSTSVQTSPTLTREASSLRAQLRSFLHQSVFAGAPINAETIPSAIGRALDWFSDCLLYLPQYERPEYNSRDSVCNALRQSLRMVIELYYGNDSGIGLQFERRLKVICDQLRKRLYSVLFVCLGPINAELYWRQLMRLMCVPLRSNFRNEALQFLCIYIDPSVPNHIDTIDAEQFLVLRNEQSTTRPSEADQLEETPAQHSLDTDIEMADVAGSSNGSGNGNGNDAIELDRPLPTITVGSEPWHNSFPNSWLPVIARDMQAQTEQNEPQPPYSDAYISGMSAKRRKIIQTEKPSSNVECLIAGGVQRAIDSGGQTGNPNVNPDAVISAIARDAVVQASYTEAVRTNARDRLKHDIDYKPGKYPHIAKFTEQK